MALVSGLDMTVRPIGQFPNGAQRPQAPSVLYS